MALSYGVSLLSTLLWGCICFPPQKGYNIAHGYSLDDEFSHHAGVPGPQASNQFHFRASLHPNQDSVSPKDEMQAMRRQSFVSPKDEMQAMRRQSFVSPKDEMQAMRRQSFVSPKDEMQAMRRQSFVSPKDEMQAMRHQSFVSPKDEMQAMRHQSFVSPPREPVYHENNKRASFVTSLSDERNKSKPESEHDVPSSRPVSKHERESSGQNPFGLLVKEHTKQKTKPSTSFSTIKDLKRFIELMKRSFLMPGNVMGRHFHTAQETIEKEMASNTQNANIMGQHDKGYRSDSAKEGTVHDDPSGNEDWSDTMNTAIEQSSNYQMPSKSLSVPDPVDSTASLVFTSVYDDQDNGPGSALYPLHHSAATEGVSSNYGGFDSGGISGENPDRFIRAPQVRNGAVQSTSYKFPKQMHSSLFFGNDLSFSGHVTASPVNPPNSPAHNFRNYSSKTLTSEKNIQQQPKYKFHSKASLTGDRKLSGLKLDKYVKSQELSRVSPANILTTPMPRSFKSYGHVIYVRAPRGQRYIPDYQPEHNKSAAKSSRAYQPIVGKQSNYIKPTAHLPVSLSSNNPSPQSSSALVGVQTSSPHNAQTLTFMRKKPVRFYKMRTAQPSSSLHGSSRHDGHLQDQTVSVSRPSTITAQPKDEKSDLFKQNRLSATWGFPQKAENAPVPVSSGLYSTNTGISSLFRDGDAKFNSLTNLAPTSASERPFSRLAANEVMSRNFGINNEISDIRGARNSLGSSSTPSRRGISLNGDYASATRPGLQTLKKTPTLWKHRAIMNKTPVNVVYHRPQLLSASIMSPPSVNSYVLQSRNRYVRSKVSLSKTHYTPSAG